MSGCLNGRLTMPRPNSVQVPGEPTTQATVTRPSVTTTTKSSVVFSTEAYTRFGPNRTKATPANVIPVHIHGSPHPAGPTINAFSAPPQARAQPGRIQPSTLRRMNSQANCRDSRLNPA